MENVRDIARWFLNKDAMTHKKLQKLCYYAQAWYVTLYNDGPLFTDEIQAWVHGPVVASLYPEYSEYKWNLIPQQNFDDSSFSDEEVNVLEAVYHTYGPFSGDQLESLTHNEDPWIIARKDARPWETSNEPITIASMREYYGKKYEQAQND